MRSPGIRVLVERLLTGAILLGLAVTGTLYSFRDSAPGIWRDFRCLPSYARESTLPYTTFLSQIETGQIRSILLSTEQANAYVTDATGTYRVKLPEFDPTWLELLDRYNVKIIELVPGSC